MYTRHFSRGGLGPAGGNGGNGGNGGGSGGGYGRGNGGAAPYKPGPRRFRGQYVRTRMSSPDNEEAPPSINQQQPYQSSHPQQHSNNLNSSNNTNSHSQQSSTRQHRNSQQNDIELIKDICAKLCVELSVVKERVGEIATNVEGVQTQLQSLLTAQTAQNSTTSNTYDNVNVKQKNKTKLLKKRQQDRSVGPSGDSVVGQNSLDSTSNNLVARNNKERNFDRQRRNKQRRDTDRDKENKPLPPPPPARPLNDDSTTQAADPSSEDKVEGEEGGERVKKVYRRKRQPFNRRGYHQRRRVDSSERNSNDTSPQNEANGDEYRQSKAGSGPRKNFPDLSEQELNETVQAIKRDFLASEMSSVRKTLDDKGPPVAKEFALAILDHTICDVTSPTKLSEIANNLAQVLVSDDVGPEFEHGFCSALNDISKREDDIAIDAPRYMDTLGQVLGQCLLPMNTGRNKQLTSRFLNKCLQSYVQQSRALLLASIMRGIAGHKDERFAKDIWDLANLNWSNYLSEDSNLEEFLDAQDVKFTTIKFSPEPRKVRKTSEEMERFADDVTDLVEKRCTTQKLDDLVKEMDLVADETVDYLGTFVYAIVRGCLMTESTGDYKLDNEAFNKYSSILKNLQQSNKEQADAIALNALTALTKLWHQFNCPQNLMSTILLALHHHGAASYDALKTWLNSDDLKNIPGIGAARLNSKRCIEDLGAIRG